MTRWEYMILDLSQATMKVDVKDLLNEGGTQGWELVATVAPHRAVFKRNPRIVEKHHNQERAATVEVRVAKRRGPRV